MKERPVFERELCNGCRLCLTVCPRSGFLLLEEVVVVNTEAECIVCKDCELVCPTGALTFPLEIVDES
jgi:NAD-dependent dihydropyrimidine dehydrogenase PreA subunit